MNKSKRDISLPSPENEMEATIIEIIKDNSLDKGDKLKYIKKIINFNTEQNISVGKSCAICPQLPSNEFLEDLLHFTVTIYIALPGTKLFLKPDTPDYDAPRAYDENQASGEISTSSAGHMWYEIKDVTFGIRDSFGFAPITTGITGPGSVTKFDSIVYDSPYYYRTLEISLEQYNKLLEYGESAVKGKNSNFDLYYNGRTNSCIDFTWKALKKAGIRPSYRYLAENSPRTIAMFEGHLKVKSNIDAIKAINPPIPNSPLNKENENEGPEDVDFLQWLLTSENQASPQTS